MKRSLTILIIGLAFVSGQIFAEEPQSPPSPTGDAAARSGSAGLRPDGSSLFVGHYGETISFPSSWTADAEMRGETEAVYFHRKSLDEFGFKPFRPKRSDYKPENFTPMSLMELAVLPKDTPGGLGSLAAIRRAKELELKKQGAEYRIFDETGESDWPRASFRVSMNKPYCLRQTYSQSPSEFYILSFGCEVEAGESGLIQASYDNINYAAERVSRSLSESLRAAERRTVAGKLFRFRDDAARGMFSVFTNFIQYDFYRSVPAARFMAAATAVMLILALWPGATAGARRARLSGRSLLFFTLFAGFLGFLTVYLPAKIADAVWNADELAEMIPVLMLPVVGWAAARGLRCSRVGRVSIAMAALAAAWAFMILWGADMENLDEASVLAFNIMFLHLIVGLTFGVAFAAAFGPLPDKVVPR